MRTRHIKATERAVSALADYAGNASCERDGLVDCLTDLRHLADTLGIDFHAALDTSYEHYCAERQLDKRNAREDEI